MCGDRVCVRSPPALNQAAVGASWSCETDEAEAEEAEETEAEDEAEAEAETFAGRQKGRSGNFC